MVKEEFYHFLALGTSYNSTKYLVLHHSLSNAHDAASILYTYSTNFNHDAVPQHSRAVASPLFKACKFQTLQ